MSIFGEERNKGHHVSVVCDANVRKESLSLSGPRSGTLMLLLGLENFIGSLETNITMRELISTEISNNAI